MSISNKLVELNGIKQDIKQAIVDKGVDMTGVEFDGYAEKIGEIPAGGTSDGYNVFVGNIGGGSTIKMLVKFSDGKGMLVGFPYWLPSTNYDDIELTNVIWLRVLEYEFTWGWAEGITKEQATSEEGYILTQNVEINIED